MPNFKKRISVIIPTFNSWVTLKPCIVSIYKQTYLSSEIIVVDNNSTDATSSNIKKYFPKVKLIKLQKNTGVTGGRNAGIKAADKKSDYLLFLDHDMVADLDMLKNLMIVAGENPTYGILTPKIFYWEDQKRIWAAGTNINLWTGQVLFRGGQDKGQFDKCEEVQVAPAAILVKEQVLKKIHGFDNRYFATYEDTDFCFRARKFGFKTIYVPSAIAFHKISPNQNQEQNRLLSRSFWIGRNRILFMKDFGKNFYLFLAFSLIYLVYFAKLALEQKDYKSFLNYLTGLSSGIKESIFKK